MYPSIQNWSGRLCIHTCKICQFYLTLQKAVWEVLRPLWGIRQTRYSLIPSQTSQLPLCNPPGLPCFTDRTSPHSDILNCVNLPSLPIEIDSNLEFEIAQILDSKLDQCKKDLLLYYVQWSGYESTVTNFIWSYLRQFFDDSHGLKTSLKPLRRPFDRCQSRLEAINNGRDIKQINW